MGMGTDKIKQELYETCREKLNGQISDLETNLKSIEESRNNETKSSVGDKYETGRAMMQQEYQKVSSQLSRIKAQASELKTLDLSQRSSKIGKGSLVVTDQGTYFLCVAIGKMSLADQVYFCISLQSPIGKLMNQKKVGDLVIFNSKEIRIKEII